MKLFSTPVTMIHDPRCMFHGSRARPACVGLCQVVSVCVSFVSVSHPYFSLYYHALTQFVSICVGYFGISKLFETFFEKSLLFFKSYFDLFVLTQLTQTLQPICTLVCSGFCPQKYLTQADTNRLVTDTDCVKLLDKTAMSYLIELNHEPWNISRESMTYH